ncbi:hypothetical protein D3C73_1540060 [compost metagenome]
MLKVSPSIVTSITALVNFSLLKKSKRTVVAVLAGVKYFVLLPAPSNPYKREGRVGAVDFCSMISMACSTSFADSFPDASVAVITK